MDNRSNIVFSEWYIFSWLNLKLTAKGDKIIYILLTEITFPYPITIMLFLCWKLIHYSWFRRYNQYLLVIFNIGYIAFNPFESSMEGMTWKHIPLDVINAVRFVVVPWKKRTQKRPYTNHCFNIIVSIKNSTNHTFSKSLTVPVYRLFISKTNLEKTWI